MTPTSDTTVPVAPLPFTFGGFTAPSGCRRIFITAELEPSNGDPRIQPTGFPDLGPVIYADPSQQHGLICLIESEASMANRLEEVCFENKYEGTLKQTFEKLPYLRAEAGKKVFKTASTLDGHRFASDFLAKGKAVFKEGDVDRTLSQHIIETLGMAEGGKTMPIANVPNIFPLVMELDSMSLIHGFQVSNEQISFVGLRLPRVLTASIVGLQCQRVIVPGIKFNVGQVESDSGQAIFQKQRITARHIEARFSIDVGLLRSLRLAKSDEQGAEGNERGPRFQLLLSIALWKIASFLDAMRVELSLRSECKLRLKRDKAGNVIPPQVTCEGELATVNGGYPFREIAAEDLREKIKQAKLPGNRSPLTLMFA